MREAARKADGFLFPPAARRQVLPRTPGGTRTHNTRILSPLPLPIGLLGQRLNGIPSEARERFGIPERPVDSATPQGERQ